tara:strand:- start:10546 stop:11667 length:1122 start_codon:yes stop_codon:yes gene_type:complete
MKFKTSLTLIFSLSILLFSSCTSKETGNFSISGKITGLNNNYILLSKVDDIQKNTNTIVDSLKVNNKGEFNSVYFLEPNIYNLTFDSKTIQIAVDKGQNIVINGNTIEDLKVKGSIDTQLLYDYEAFRKESLNRLVNTVRNEIRELKKTEINELKIAELREVEVENYEKHLNELIDFVKNNMGTSIAIYHSSTRWNTGENLPFLQLLVSNFEEKHPTIEITNKLKNKLHILEKTNVASIVSNIEMPNKNTDLISLNTIKGTYTLVNFWASWCPPCRAESVLLNELYNSFHSKGFEIYGISLDSKRENWLKAIEKDKRVWPEVSTVEGFNTPVSIEYGITALPLNFLIDSTGKIIAVNIHGTTLKEKITELLSN